MESRRRSAGETAAGASAAKLFRPWEDREEEDDWQPPPPPGPPPRSPTPPPPPPAPEPSPWRLEQERQKRKARIAAVVAKAARRADLSTPPGSPSRTPSASPTRMATPESLLQHSSAPSSPGASESGESTASSTIPHQLPDFNPEEYYHLEERDPITFKGGQVTQEAFKVRITQDVGDDVNIERLERIQAILYHAFHTAFANAPRGSIAQVFVENENMYNKFKPTRRCRIEDLTFDDVALQLSKIEQSSKDSSEDEQVHLEDTVFTLVTYEPKPTQLIGGQNPTGMKARNEASMYHFMRRSQTFIDPMAKRNRIPESMQDLCVPFCIVMAQKRIELDWKPRNEEDSHRAEKLVAFKDYVKSPTMRRDAQELVKQARLKPETGPFTMKQIRKLQRRALGEDYQVNIFDSDRPPIESFGEDRAPYHINLLVREDLVPNPKEGKAHAVLITTMQGFMGKQRHYCNLCKKTYYRESNHRCDKAACRHCQLDVCENLTNIKTLRPYKTCSGCNYTYMTKGCYKAHKKAKICDKRVRCQYCRKVVMRKKKAANDEEEDEMHDHKCGMIRCQQCKKEHFPTEWCYVRPVPKKLSPNHPDNHQQNKAKKDKDPDTALLEAGEQKEDESSDDGEAAESEGEEKEPESLEVLLGKKKLWYADAETMVDPVTNNHIANLLILQQPRHDKGPEEFERRVYKGPTAMRQFVEDCMKTGSEYTGSTVVFHNASGFDAHLWQRELLLLGCPPKNPIYKGERILTFTMQQNKIKVIDSLQFVPNTPLSKFPDMFGLQSGPKGEFPHYLNTPEWVDLIDNPDKVYEEQDEEGTLHRFPQLKYFHPENKRPKELEKLKKWHADQVKRFEEDPSLEYKPARELEAYCDQDVTILRLGCEVMRGSWLKQFPDMELFDFLTFPSFNNALFRTKYMAKDSIVLLPPEGFHLKNRKYSRQAMAWLSMVRAEWAREGRPLTEFRHARNGFEVSIASYHVDGWGKDADGNQHVFQYHGCWWHGCQNCMLKWSHKMKDAEREQRTIHRSNTMATSIFLRQLGQDPDSPYGQFTLHEMWECDWKKMTGQDLEGEEAQDSDDEEEDLDELAKWRRDFTNHYLANWVDKADRLKPSDAFKGARTNVIQHLIAEVPIGFLLRYYDFTSLYPSVNFSIHDEEWPVGHPDVYIGSEVEDAPPLEEAFGLWKVDILPPKHLRHPVLGQTINDKLIFHLCTLCAKTNRQGYCKHSASSRMIKKGTFFTGELKLAVSKGYVIQRVYEVWDWPQERRTRDLFKGLIRDQYGKKVLASGAPADPAELENIIREHWVSMGLELLPEAFRKDPAMRALAKFSLNNIWGFLGKREDVASTIFTDDIEVLNKLENDPDREVTQVHMPQINPDGTGSLLMVQHKPKENKAGPNGSIMLALLTTAYARMELYKIIDQYKEEVVYFDTDSVILLLPPGKPPPATSSRLGDLKDEVLEEHGPDARMTSFASLGPKVYTYKVCDKEDKVLAEPMKLKGVSVTAKACETIKPQLLYEMAGDRDAVETVEQFQIRRKMKEGRLYNHYFMKKLRVTSGKRWILPNDNPTLNTLPFGYKKEKKKKSK